MKRRDKQRWLAVLLSTAVLAQGVAAMPHPPMLEAAAASVQTIQTRVFEYDFGAFQALYDTRTGRWFDKAGAPIAAQDNAVQRLENPHFEDENAGSREIRAFLISMSAQTISVELEDGSTLSAEDYYGVNGAAFPWESEIFAILAVRPEYAAQYYDKAQQTYVNVPEPEHFPLNYVWEPDTLHADQPDYGSYCCKILFGEIEYGCCYLRLEDDFHIFTEFEKAGAISETGTADPFTDAGDASVDGTQDVSDAVLTCRVVAEIENTPVSELGLDLADKNEDGLITGSDAIGILCDIAKMPTPEQQPHLPEGAIPVISQQKQDVRDDDEAAWDETAKSFDYESGQAFFDQLAYGGAMELKDWQLVEGEQSDTLRIAYSRKYGSSLYFEIQGLHIDADGILNITGGVCRYSDTMYPIIFVRELQVAHGALPEITGIQLTGNAENRYGTDLDLFYADIPETLYFTVEQQPAQESIPVTGLEMQHHSMDDLAAIFDYESGEALLDEISRMNVDTQNYSRCTEGDTYDIWDFAYRSDDLQCHGARINSLTLAENGMLYIHAATLYEPDIDAMPTNWIQFRLTVPHGALPKGDLPVFWRITELIATDDGNPPFSAVKEIFRTAAPEGAIPISDLKTASYTPEDYTDLDDLLQMLGFDAIDYETLTGGAAGVDTAVMLRTESDDGDRYRILVMAAPGWHGWNQQELESVHLGADGKLTLTTREYSYGRELSMREYSKYWAAVYSFTVPHDALPNYTQPNWSRTEAVDFAVPEVTYITAEQQLPYGESAGVYAEVQVDSNGRYQEDTEIIPEDVRTELGDSYETFLFRQYTEAAQTDDAALKTILNTGKDILALYTVRPDMSATIGVTAGEVTDGVLSLKIAEHKQLGAEQAIEYIRILLITPDGTMPEITNVETEIFKFSDTSGTSLLTQFQEAAKNPAYIAFSYPDGIRAEVAVLNGWEDGGEYGIIPEDVLQELEPNNYIFRQYREEAETENSNLRGILSQGKDVLAVYTLRGDGGSDFGVMSANLYEGGVRDGILNLTLAEHRDAEVAAVECVHGILLITEDGALPDLNSVQVNTELFVDIETEYFLTDGSFAWVEEDTRPEFEAACVNPVYIGSEPETQTGIETEFQHTFLSTNDMTEAELAILERLNSGEISVLAQHTIDEAALQTVMTDDTKDTYMLYTQTGDSNSEYGVIGGEVDADGVLHLQLAEHHSMVSGLSGSKHMQRFMLSAASGELPVLTGCEYEITGFYDREVFGSDVGYNGFAFVSAEEEFRAAVQNPVYIQTTEQNPRILLRNSVAGTLARYLDDIEAHKDITFSIEPLKDSSYTDDSTEFDWQDAILSAMYWSNGTPELKNGDLLAIVFSEENQHSAFGVQNAVLDSAGVLRLTVVRCAEAEPEALWNSYSEDNSTLCAIAMIGESGAFEGITDVQISYNDAADYAAYLNARADAPAIIIK